MSRSALVVGKFVGRPRNGDNGCDDRGYRPNFAGFFRGLAGSCGRRQAESIGRGVLVGGRLGLPDGSLEVDSTRPRLSSVFFSGNSFGCWGWFQQRSYEGLRPRLRFTGLGYKILPMSTLALLPGISAPQCLPPLSGFLWRYDEYK